MAGVPMPTEKDLPPGEHRFLVEELHRLYRGAGKPSTRLMAAAIRKSDDLKGTISHEGIGAILRGETIPKWNPTLDTLTRYLCSASITGEETAEVIKKVHALWLRTDDRQPETASFQYECTMDLVICVLVRQRESIPAVQQNLLFFHDVVTRTMKKKGKHPTQVRIKVICGLNESRFFSLPDEQGQVNRLVLDLKAADRISVDLIITALDRAVRSEWYSDDRPYKHHILVLSDEPDDGIADEYPGVSTRDLERLGERWMKSQPPGHENLKALTLMAPDLHPWTHIAEEWPITLHWRAAAGEDVEDYEMDEIAETLANEL